MRRSDGTAIAVSLAIAGLCCGGAATAATTATATMGRYTISYLDLDPGDGIAPALTFAAGTSTSYSQSNASFAGFGSQGADGAYAATASTTVGVEGSSSANTSVAGASAVATILGSEVDGFSMYANATAYPLQAVFAVTPRSAVTITVPVHLAAATTIGIRGTNSEYGKAQAFIYVDFTPQTADAGHNVQYVYQSILAAYARHPETGQYEPQSAAFDGTFTFDYINPGDAPVTGSMMFYADASAGSSLSTFVPEPPASLLLLAGVAAVAGVTRRRFGAR